MAEISIMQRQGFQCDILEGSFIVCTLIFAVAKWWERDFELCAQEDEFAGLQRDPDFGVWSPNTQSQVCPLITHSSY